MRGRGSDVARQASSTTGLIFSFLKIFATIFLGWGCGYLNWSVAWFIVPILWIVLNKKWKKESDQRKLANQASVLAGKQKAVGNGMVAVPSSSHFPDFDKAEWLNKILLQLWPNVNEFVRQLCKQQVEPAVCEKLMTYGITGFAFEELVLGKIPPRIEGIKVYDKNTADDEIILDADIVYGGDCDISFYCGYVTGGIRDFQVRGKIRVVMKPLLPVMPLVGGLQISFLEMPAVDFSIVGTAGLINYIGLSEILRNAVADQIGAIMVLPNKIPIALSSDVSAKSLDVLAAPANVIETSKTKTIPRSYDKKKENEKSVWSQARIESIADVRNSIIFNPFLNTIVSAYIPDGCFPSSNVEKTSLLVSRRKIKRN